MVKQREWGRVSVKDTFYFKIRRSVERRDAHVNFQIQKGMRTRSNTEKWGDLKQGKKNIIISTNTLVIVEMGM